MIKRLIKYSRLSVLIIIFLSLSLNSTSAQSTPSSETTSTQSAESEDEKVKDIRDALKEKVKEKVDEKIEEVKTQSRIKGFFGEIKEIAEKILTIEALGGERLAKLGDETEIVLFEAGKKETIEFEDLALGNFAIVMGYATQNGTIEAKRIVVTKEVPESTNRQALLGTIESLDKTSIILKNKNGETFEIKTDKNTEIKKKINDEFKEIEIDDLSEGDVIVLIGIPSKSDDKILTASKIRVLSSKEPEEKEEEQETEETKEKEEATPSSSEEESS